MARKQTWLERLTSLLRGESAAACNSKEEAIAPSTDETPLATEWATYQAHKRELLQHEGQWVVIHGAQILGIRAAYEDALRLGYERAGYVDFLVHQILASEPVHLLPPQPI
jgi:hypothetical protein